MIALVEGERVPVHANVAKSIETVAALVVKAPVIVTVSVVNLTEIIVLRVITNLEVAI